MIIKTAVRKSMEIKPSGRSTDFLSPTFIMGCGFNCSYCYCKRHVNDILNVATNIDDILKTIDDHVNSVVIKKPNQTHATYITYDLGCNSDMALHIKLYDWVKVFDFFKYHSKAMGSFATKYVNEKLLNYNPEQKLRIRFSLMPQSYSDLLEPNTTSIIDRIKAIDRFIATGWDVHINFSPVIIEKGWLKEYEGLFKLVNDNVINKDKVKAEVIFLTHNEKKHNYNLENNLLGEDLLWKPEIQENKISQYGGANIRYKHTLKAKYIDKWKELHKSIIPWNTIRYIF